MSFQQLEIKETILTKEAKSGQSFSGWTFIVCNSLEEEFVMMHGIILRFVTFLFFKLLLSPKVKPDPC